VEVPVVDLEAGRFGARRDALVALDREEAVVGRAAGLRAEPILGVLEQLVAAVEEARDRGADVDGGQY